MSDAEYLVGQVEEAKAQGRGTDAARYAKQLAALGLTESGKPIAPAETKAEAAESRRAAAARPDTDEEAERAEPPKERKSPRDRLSRG